MSRLFRFNYIYLALSIITGVILWIAWPPHTLPVFLFVAFVPLLWIENRVAKLKPRYGWSTIFIFHFIAFLLWNFLSTGWIYYATGLGMLGAIFANAILMSIPFLFYHITKKYLGSRLGMVSLILYWVSYEYLHFQWELAWPWLALGNGFASAPKMIQWYEYTGVFGGTCWILITNFLVLSGLLKYKRVKEYFNNSLHWRSSRSRIAAIFISTVKPVAIVLIPFLISIIMFNRYSPSGNIKDVLIIQPNIDPYNEKFSGMGADEQLVRLIELSSTKLDADVDYLVWPETSVTHDILINRIDEDETIEKLRQFVSKYPKLKLVSGFSPTLMYDNGETLTPTARKYMDGTCCYDVFNSSMQIENEQAIQIYHKSKLVPGVERMPYPRVFKFLERFALNMGGIYGSLGVQEERGVFTSTDNERIAPVICYESIFGEFVSDYIKNGAQSIFIITNDGWWEDTDGYKQHLSYASLRAIETRRDIARSANTGVSCFIDQRGIISQPTNYWEQATIRAQILFNDKMTFYTIHGDYIARIAVFVGTIFLLLTIVSALTNKFKFRRK